MNNPSQHEANKLVRVLTGDHLKYTIRVHRLNGAITEYQANLKPDVKWNDQTRSLWIHSGGYEGHPVMELEAGAIILCEENPKP